MGSGLAIPEGHAHAVATILGCIGGKSVRVRDLVLLGDEGDDASQTKLLMVQALHSLGARLLLFIRVSHDFFKLPAAAAL